MTAAEKRRMQAAFFDKLGENTRAFVAALDLSRDVCLNMKDAEGRIMALNRRNCEVCNIRCELDAVGRRSRDLFAPIYAETYMALDREALTAKRPILNRVTNWPADGSPDFMVSCLFPLKNRRGRTIGTLHAYRLVRDAGPDARRFGSMRKVVDHVRQHLSEPISLADLAALVGMSVTNFRREFAAVFKTTPGAYVGTMRLNAARKMLETTELTLAQIATSCGFCDAAHLSNAFKRSRGETPAAYRAKCRA